MKIKNNSWHRYVRMYSVWDIGDTGLTVAAWSIIKGSQIVRNLFSQCKQPYDVKSHNLESHLPKP